MKSKPPAVLPVLVGVGFVAVAAAPQGRSAGSLAASRARGRFSPVISREKTLIDKKMGVIYKIN
ncbi:MAG: hypothetical protein A2139_00175 [Desulfobacca sp. RBG_16_60_12]|nr:MAG: hypothetical protein A2139_00175 [Desulfobacca sp. RBG_16_60_12]